MVRIIETDVDLAYALGHHLHCLVAQIPVRLCHSGRGISLVDPEAQWRSVRSVLDLVAQGEGNLKKLHFLAFPEVSIPFGRFDDVLAQIEGRFRFNTVTMFGVEHVAVDTYCALLERFASDNAEALALVRHDLDSGEVLQLPVNWCCVAVKEATGRLRVFLEAKTHPFSEEEFVDARHDLYRGRHFYLFRAQPSCFNFMVLVCLDYLYRDLFASNIRQIIDHANHLYFRTRQTLDALFVVQCSPKPEHRAYREVLSGFYGEYLEDTPGVRETVTLFANASDESALRPGTAEGRFGASSVVMGRRHKLAPVSSPEFETDDFQGAPVCRLRFGTETRLCYISLPLHHELDPRSCRVPLKVHAVLRPEDDGHWVRIGGEVLADVTPASRALAAVPSTRGRG